ncbi:hypothetical protein AB434_2709 [Heyndrickxia coagulans]|uniref:Uncharacterized protein n=1 Tax=Heyndrickxia coagulans TaxID=1398 RepID=A0AAN0T7P3_HEYCO|nr:hypothetical protein SB48_HM08orf04135 [Heyndrickxia coagulans]AKN55114.1 hypothetical protein AB434_2709 [Heyndrickxia coagulans]
MGRTANQKAAVLKPAGSASNRLWGNELVFIDKKQESLYSVFM